MAKTKRSGDAMLIFGPCPTCSAFTPMDSSHDCAKVLRAKEKAAAESSKKQAKHCAVNDKKKRQAPPPPPPPSTGTTATGAPRGQQ